MKTKKYIFWPLLLLLFCQGVTAQSLMDKYWRERYKLVNYYMVVGDGQGESIPADRRDYGLIHWGDAALYLGDYIGLLATEYRLLKNNGQPVDRTLFELHYALLALERLDRNTTLPLAYPYTYPYPDGCMLCDDVPGDFLTTHPQLSQDDAGNTLPYFWQVPEGDPYFTSQMYSSYNNGTNGKLISQDHFSHILLGIAFVKKYVDNAYLTFTGIDSHTGQQLQLTDNLVQRGIDIINNVTTWAMNGTGSNDWHYADPFGDGIPSENGGNWGPFSDGFGQAASFITGQTYPPDYFTQFMFQNMQDFKCARQYPNTLHIAIALATTGDSWVGPFIDGHPNTTATGIAFQGDYNAWNGECDTDIPLWPANHYGWNLFYGLAYRLLHDKDISDIDLCMVRNILEACPYSGPYFHASTNKASGSWASTNRWNADPPEQENGTNVDAYGNYNGQDFMYLNNLYYLAMQESEFPRGGVYPQQPYFAWEGDTHNPKYFFEAYLKLDNLTVTTVNMHVGDVEAWGTGYVDVTNTSCDQNAYLHITCAPQTNWCIVDGEDYLGNTSWNFNRITSSNVNDTSGYTIGTQFQNKYGVNSISNYPNPVGDNTTVTYNIVENSPVKITLFDATGRVVQVLLDKPFLEKGNHSMNIDASNLASGIYYITMQGNKFSVTQKFVKT